MSLQKVHKSIGGNSAGGAGVVVSEKAMGTPPILSEISHLEIKVGKILEIKEHPEADSLYIETVDVGEPQPRIIVSGLVKYCRPEELLHRSVIVLCNLKPRALKGVLSHGMLLCASDPEHTQVDPLTPPPGTKIGERIVFDGHLSQPGNPSNRVNKAFERVVGDLLTSSEGVATYQGKIPFMTPLGPCRSRIKNGKIS
jgi:methionine--tRNA ligase beta chain